MEKIKRDPKLAFNSLALAFTSLVLLIIALLLFFMSWITAKQASLGTFLVSQIPSLSDGSLSFSEGISLMNNLNKLNNSASLLVGQTGLDFKITALTIAYHILFWGSILAVIYCIYARVKWQQGLREGTYFLFFVGDICLMYLLMGQLNELCGPGTFGFAPWGILAVVCALLSEIFWEEASFNTPNPLQDIVK